MSTHFWHAASINDSLGPDLLVVCASANPLLVIKHSWWDWLKMHSEKLAMESWGQSYFCSWPYCICICRTANLGGGDIKLITQCDLLMFFGSWFTANCAIIWHWKKHVLILQRYWANERDIVSVHVFVSEHRVLFAYINIFSSKYNLCFQKSHCTGVRHKQGSKHSGKERGRHYLKNILIGKAHYSVPVCAPTNLHCFW